MSEGMVISAPGANVTAIIDAIEPANTTVPIPIGSRLYTGVLPGPAGVAPHAFGAQPNMSANVNGAGNVTCEPSGALSPAHGLGIAAVRCQLGAPQTNVAHAAVTTPLSAASGNPRLAALLSRFVLGTAGGGITARGQRLTTSVLRQVPAAGDHAVWMGYTFSLAAVTLPGFFGFAATHASPNWRALVTVAGIGTPLIDVDTGIDADTSHTLDLRIVQGVDTVPVAQWIIDGVLRHQQVGGIAGFTPLTTSTNSPLDWTAGFGALRPVTTGALVDFYACVNDTFEIWHY